MIDDDSMGLPCFPCYLRCSLGIIESNLSDKIFHFSRKCNVLITIENECVRWYSHIHIIILMIVWFLSNEIKKLVEIIYTTLGWKWAFPISEWTKCHCRIVNDRRALPSNSGAYFPLFHFHNWGCNAADKVCKKAHSYKLWYGTSHVRWFRSPNRHWTEVLHCRRSSSITALPENRFYRAYNRP